MNSNSPDSPPLIDRRFLLAVRRGLGPTRFAQTLDLFEKHGAVMVGVIASDAPLSEKRKNAHRLIGASGNLGLKALAEATRQVSQQLKAGMPIDDAALTSLYQATLKALSKAISEWGIPNQPRS